jgi:hypothetical protein
VFDEFQSMLFNIRENDLDGLVAIPTSLIPFHMWLRNEISSSEFEFSSQ